MGTWGYHSFDNDPAMDWVAGPLSKQGVAAISAAFDGVLGDDAPAQIDADTAQIAIAAADTLAATLGHPRAEDTAVLPKLSPLKDAAAKDLVQRATYAIMAITGASELRDLWEDADWDEREGWLAALTDLRRRVNGEIEIAEASTASADLADQQSLEDIRLAIASLDARLSEISADVMASLARISRKVEALSK